MTNKMREGSYSYSVIPVFVELGRYTSIGADCYFHEPNDNHLCIENRKCVYTTNWDQPSQKLPNTIIGNDVWIGRGVRVLPSIRVGNGVIIGAGAVVSKDIPDYAVVVGNPAKIVRFRFTEEQINKLNKIKWWMWEKDVCLERLDDFKDIDKFIEKYG